MRLSQKLAALSIAVFALNTQAASVKSPQAAPAAKQTAQKEDKNLTQFNQNVGIRLIQRSNAEKDNKPVVVLVYEIENRGKNKIRSVEWTSAFTVENNAFFAQNIRAELGKSGLAPKKKNNITVTLPVDTLPQQVQAVFANTQTAIGSVIVAKSLNFTNGKKITVN